MATDTLPTVRDWIAKLHFETNYDLARDQIVVIASEDDEVVGSWAADTEFEAYAKMVYGMTCALKEAN